MKVSLKETKKAAEAFGMNPHEFCLKAEYYPDIKTYRIIDVVSKFYLVEEDKISTDIAIFERTKEKPLMAGYFERGQLVFREDNLDDRVKLKYARDLIKAGLIKDEWDIVDIKILQIGNNKYASYKNVLYKVSDTPRVLNQNEAYSLMLILFEKGESAKWYR